MRICCIGDSNTYGYDPQAPMGGRYPREIRWTGRLAAAGHSVANHGCCGLPVTRRSLHAMFAKQAASEGPFDLVTVMLGSNDILLGSSAREAAADCEHLIEVLKECLGETAEGGAGMPEPGSASPAAPRILLIAPVPFIRGFWVENDDLILRSKELSPEYAPLTARQHVLFADAGTWGIPLAYDGVHFTAEGHRIFAGKMLEIL